MCYRQYRLFAKCFGCNIRTSAIVSLSVSHTVLYQALRCSAGKKKLQADPSCCPVCGVTLRAAELESHFVHELERLYKLSAGGRARRLPADARPGADPLPPGPATAAGGQRRDGGSAAADGTPEGRWDTYQRIRTNRQSRLRIKNRKRKADEATCPVCNERMQGSMEELNGHVEICLRKNGGAPDEEENVDVEGDSEMFEEYEWAGQRRIRATTLLVGGFAATGMATVSSRPSPVDDEVDLVVDGDDTATYGPPQYCEADVVVMTADGQRDALERDALREALISPDGSKRDGAPGAPPGSTALPATPGAPDLEAKKETASGAGPGLSPRPGPTGPGPGLSPRPGPTGPGPGPGSAAASPEPAPAAAAACPAHVDPSPLLEALKSRIRELEDESEGAEKFKCLICMERYKKPVISVCCWHVHCEECWLHTLGAKKLCPQCNMITSPADLRRIYM